VCDTTQTRKTSIEALENEVELNFFIFLFFFLRDESDTQGGIEALESIAVQGDHDVVSAFHELMRDKNA